MTRSQVEFCINVEEIHTLNMISLHFEIWRKCALFTWIVYLQTPRVFHSLMVLSLEPDTI